LRAGDAQRTVGIVLILQAVGAGTLAHQVDDLVLQHGCQPGAQGGAAGKRGATRQYGFEDIVHHVLGQHRVLQPALRETYQILAVRDHFGPADGQGRRRGERKGRVGGDLHGGLLGWQVAMG
jgi:hypothetical protein